MGVVRFLLALCVVVTHYPGGQLLGHSLMSGVTAVQAFYVISGFLMTMVLSERAEYASLSNFYLSRYLRLWPTYAVIALASLCFSWPHWVQRVPHNLGSIAYVILTNATLIGQDWALFLRFGADGSLIPTTTFGQYPHPWVVETLLVPQAWTLGVELSFYLIAPFFCRRVSTTLLLFALGITVRYGITVFEIPGDVWYYRFFPAELTMFAAGGLAYHAGKLLRPAAAHWALRTVGCAVLAAIVAMIVFDAARPSSINPALWLVNPMVLLCMVIACPFLFHATRRSAVDSFIGELSYPMYVCHMLVFALASRVLGHTPADWLYVFAVVVASAFLFVCVALPIDQVRARFGARVPPSPVIARPLSVAASPRCSRRPSSC